jgi:hypothetical protein
MSVKQQHEETTCWEFGQKKLVLRNLQKLYVAFLWETPNYFNWIFQISRIVSKTLHPCRCKRDPYSMCQCDSSEQNTHGAMSMPYSWFQCKKPFLKKIMCSTKSETCALTQCESHPDSDAVCKLLSTMDNFEFGDEITYRQWVTTVRSTLMAIVPCKEFIGWLISFGPPFA